MDDPFLVRVLHGVTDLDEQVEPICATRRWFCSQ